MPSLRFPAQVTVMMLYFAGSPDEEIFCDIKKGRVLPGLFLWLLISNMAGCFHEPPGRCHHSGPKPIIMETLTNIVRGTMAHMVHVCSGKVIYQIETGKHLYQLEIDSNEKEWETTYLVPEFKSITLMRWIRKGIENRDGTFIQLK